MSSPHVLVCSGPRATITNAPPLVTSREGRHGDEGAERSEFGHLVPQYLHASATVKVETFSAHPMESDAAEVYHDADREYQEVTLDPSDGPYLLPYVARRADGSDDGTPFEPDDITDPELDFGGRQFFYPDASRIFEEIDRTVYGRDRDGTGNVLGEKATYEFVRPLPPAGYTKRGEQPGEDYFPYWPKQRAKTPRLRDLATAANAVQRHLDEDNYDGVLWLGGSPRLEETLYWLQLLVDTTLPIVGTASINLHGQVANDGAQNIVDGVEYIVSGKGDGLGAVAVQDRLVYAAREFKKADARPGGFEAVGGHGGVLGSVSADVRVQFIPNYAHTSDSDVNLTALPECVSFYDTYGDATKTTVRVTDDDGLIETAIPRVSILKAVAYPQRTAEETPDREVAVTARIEQALEEQADDADDSPDLHGLVFEGTSPYGTGSSSLMAALRKATYSGVPVVRVGRSDPGGFVPPDDTWPTIEGSNLDANKAVLLLTAALLKLGRLPKATDPDDPASAERDAIVDRIAAFQRLFDTH